MLQLWRLAVCGCSNMQQCDTNSGQTLYLLNAPITTTGYQQANLLPGAVVFKWHVSYAKVIIIIKCDYLKSTVFKSIFYDTICQLSVTFICGHFHVYTQQLARAKFPQKMSQQKAIWFTVNLK